MTELFLTLATIFGYGFFVVLLCWRAAEQSARFWRKSSDKYSDELDRLQGEVNRLREEWSEDVRAADWWKNGPTREDDGDG